MAPTSSLADWSLSRWVHRLKYPVFQEHWRGAARRGMALACSNSNSDSSPEPIHLYAKSVREFCVDGSRHQYPMQLGRMTDWIILASKERQTIVVGILLVAKQLGTEVVLCT